MSTCQHAHAHVHVHVHVCMCVACACARRAWLAAALPPARNLTDHLPPACRLGAIADLRVGNQRLGPSKSRRLHRVLMATREQAEDHLVP